MKSLKQIVSSLILTSPVLVLADCFMAYGPPPPVCQTNEDCTQFVGGVCVGEELCIYPVDYGWYERRSCKDDKECTEYRDGKCTSYKELDESSNSLEYKDAKYCSSACYKAAADVSYWDARQVSLHCLTDSSSDAVSDVDSGSDN